MAHSEPLFGITCKNIFAALGHKEGYGCLQMHCLEQNAAERAHYHSGRVPGRPHILRRFRTQDLPTQAHACWSIPTCQSHDDIPDLEAKPWNHASYRDMHMLDRQQIILASLRKFLSMNMRGICTLCTAGHGKLKHACKQICQLTRLSFSSTLYRSAVGSLGSFLVRPGRSFPLSTMPNACTPP